MYLHPFFIFLLFVCSCTSPAGEKKPENNKIEEKITRKQGDNTYSQANTEMIERAAYPWEQGQGAKFSRITKDFFRCKGSSLNPVKMVPQGNEMSRYYDCGGVMRHSLPLRDGKEFIYPILIDLLNYLQNKTGKKVVITCGHRCPEHNAYVDSSNSNMSSKHMLGAEVDFYIQGLEAQPQKVVELIQSYYKETPKYKGLKDFQEFKRYEKSDSNVALTPWINKEIFIKIYSKNEGRDFDNRHPYSYLSLQVRFDFEKQEKVQYSWDQAYRNFHRY